MLLGKADNIRMISKDSFFFIRDSPGGSEGIIVDNSGNLQLRGEKVFIGKASGREPYIKYSVYKETIDMIVAAISALYGSVGAAAAGEALRADIAIKNTLAKSSVVFGE